MYTKNITSQNATIIEKTDFEFEVICKKEMDPFT